jgi:hypothetical protein
MTAKLWPAFLLLLCSAASAAPATSFQNTLFSAKSESLGGAYAGQADEAEDMLFNPAALGELKTSQAGFQHLRWLGDTLQESAFMALAEGDLGGLGAELALQDGTMSGIDASGNPVQGLAANAAGFGLGAGKRMFDFLSAGGTLKLVRQDQASQSFQTLAGDLGVMAEWEDLRFSVSGLNLGTGNGSPQAGLAKADASFQYFPEDRTRLLVCAGYSVDFLGNGRLQMGCEAGLKDLVYVRGGLDHDLQNVEVKGLHDFAAGAGLHYKSVWADYSYRPYGDAGATHRVGLSISFQPKTPVSRPHRQPSPGRTPSRTPVRTPVPVPTEIQTLPPVQHAYVSPKPAESGAGLELYFKASSDNLSHGQRLIREGKIHEALDWYNQALTREPNNGALWRGLGECFYQLGNKDLALRCFDRSLELKPDETFQQWKEKYERQ